MFDPSKLLSDLVFYRTYSKTLENGRKESFNETVARSEQMHLDKFKGKISNEIHYAFNAVRDGLVVPSMRSMQFASDPINKENARIYNCSATTLTSFKSFSDLFYLLMCGCGTGYSVQNRHISQLPVIRDSMENCTFIVPDSREGWADSVGFLFKNPRCSFDYSLIRPAGAPLSSGGTASGAGPLKKSHAKIREILISAIGRKLRPVEAHSIMCHIADAVVVGGVRRSSAICLFDPDDMEMLTCKSGNWWETNPQYARCNNTAVINRADPYAHEYFDSIMDRMFASFAGEPGIAFVNDNEWLYNPCQPAWAQVLTPDGIRTFADIDAGSTIWSGKRWTKVIKKWSTGVKQVNRYITSGGVFEGTENHRVVQFGEKIEVSKATHIDSQQDSGSAVFTLRIEKIEPVGEYEVFDITVDDEEHTYWTKGCIVSNCGEISLKAFCNLTEINAPACRTPEDFYRAATAATIIGKIQSTYTKFNYLSPSWKKHAEDEMLLGVSITGQAEAQHILTPEILRNGANILMETDKKLATILDIPLAHRIGTTKPSGSTSALLGTTSGVHAAHSPYYLRRVRVDVSDPIAIYLADKYGVNDPCTNSVVELDKFNPSNIVVSIPINKTGAIYRGIEGPVQLMERAKIIHENWIRPSHRQGPNTHNVSITVNYKEDEKDSVRKWMWENRESYAAMSLLPYDLGTYVQMPFDEITESQYHDFRSKFTENIDFSEIDFSGTTDERLGETACGGGGCEIK